MDLKQLPLFQLFGKKMAWLNQRQRVISENLANADTPNYRAKTLEEPDFSAYVSQVTDKLKMHTTDAEHLKSGQFPGRVSAEEAVIQGKEEISPTGNSVNLTEEMMKVSDTRIQYNMTTNLYKKHMQMLRVALGRGR